MSHHGSSRLVPVAAGLAVLLVLAAAVTFARADQAERLAADAVEVRAVEQALAEVATYRADLAIAVVAAATVGESSAWSEALAAGEEVLGRLEADLAGLDEPELVHLGTTVRDSTRSIRAALDRKDLQEAERVAGETVVPALDRLSAALGNRSAAVRARMDQEMETAGKVARASSFMVALVAPALGLWSLRRAMGRRLQRQRLELALQRERDLARAKDQLIAGFSHQLRTPLTGIAGFAQTLLEADEHGKADGALVREAVSTILDQSRHLHGMVEDILVAARSDAEALTFSLTPTEVSPVVERVADAFRRAGHQVEVCCEPGCVLTDADRLGHVLRNLLSNALRHGRGVAVVGREVADRYLLAVEDEGPGVSDDVVERLFTPFLHDPAATTVSGGLGLGLSVARTLAVRMGATLHHERLDGRTRFVLSLPHSATGDDRGGNRVTAAIG